LFQRRVTVRDMFFNEANRPSDHPVWTVAMVDNLREKLRRGVPVSSYGLKDSLVLIL
jgi:hypothetical protein